MTDADPMIRCNAKYCGSFHQRESFTEWSSDGVDDDDDDDKTV